MKILKYAIIGILIVAAIYYSAMFIDVYPVISEVRSAFLGELTEEEIGDSPISRYDRSYLEELLDEDEEIGPEFFIIVPVTLHNFKKGDIWAFYIFISYTSEGRVCGGDGAYTNWEIQKINGDWDIIKINEGI